MASVLFIAAFPSVDIGARIRDINAPGFHGFTRLGRYRMLRIGTQVVI